MIIEPTERLTVVLTAQQWDAVLNTIADAHAPYRVTAPLIAEIQRQCMRQDQSAALPSTNAPQHGNGEVRNEGDRDA